MSVAVWRSRARNDCSKPWPNFSPTITRDSGHETVFERLLERERLGSTGLGHGIALPHARLKDVSEVLGAFVQTAQGVDYDAADGEPVDLAFALLVPEAAHEEHLHLLAHLASLFSDARVRARLREARSAAELLQVLNTP